MTREPFRWKPHWGHEKIDPARCRASVASGRAGVFQCGNKVKEGVEFCAKHLPLKAADDAPVLWAVDIGYGRNAKPEIVTAKIVKETKKQIIVADTKGSAFGYKTRLRKKDDGSPEEGYRTKLEAVEAYLAQRNKELARAKEVVIEAELRQHEAEALLAKVKKETE